MGFYPAVREAKAAIAQLVEHFIRNEKVVGSSPTRGSGGQDLTRIPAFFH